MSMMRLPEEIQVDIFLRLPVKSIQSCRCVCKTLCNLLYNPKFIKDHILNSNKKNPRLMLISCWNNYYPITCRSIDSSSILSASSLASPASTAVTCDGAIPMNNDFFQGDRDPFNRIDVVGSCNGLICLRMSNQKECKFGVWNPLTSEYKILSCFRDMFGQNSMRGICGFGYDLHLDDYKLVRIVKTVAHGTNLSYNIFSQVEVYTLGSNSYKTIQFMNNQYPVLTPGHSYVWLLNGALHWPGFSNATSSRVIVSFDISCETFVDFLYPEEIINHKRTSNPDIDHLGLLEDRLCLILCGGSQFLDVWVMLDYGVPESWTKQASIKRSFVIETYYFKLAWCSTDGKVLIDVGYRKILYDPKNDSTRDFKVHGFDHTAWSRPVSYVESLVSLDKSGPIFGWVKECNANEAITK